MENVRTFGEGSNRVYCNLYDPVEGVGAFNWYRRKEDRDVEILKWASDGFTNMRWAYVADVLLEETEGALITAKLAVMWYEIESVLRQERGDPSGQE